MKKLIVVFWCALILPLGIKSGSVLLNALLLSRNALDGAISYGEAYSAMRQMANNLWTGDRLLFVVWAIGLIALFILSVRYERKERLSRKESVRLL